MKKFAIFALVVLALMASVAAWGFSRGEPRVVEGAFVIGGVLLAAGFVLTGVEFFFEDPFSAFGGLLLPRKSGMVALVRMIAAATRSSELVMTPTASSTKKFVNSNVMRPT